MRTKFNEKIWVAGYLHEIFFFDGPTRNLQWLLNRRPPYVEYDYGPAFIWEYIKGESTARIKKRYRWHERERRWVELKRQ
jgi:hypothetical protein